MRLAHFRTDGGAALGLGVGEEVVRLDAVASDAPATSLDFLAAADEQRTRWQQQARDAVCDAVTADRLRERGALGHIDEVALAAPVPTPQKILCLALNYRSHADEGGFQVPTRPVVFLKGTNTLTGHRSDVTVPACSSRIDHEGELVVVIGRRCRNVAEDDAPAHIGGYTIMNDMTARDWQLEDIDNRHPWDLTKSFDGYGPTGPWLLTPDEVPDPQDIPIEVRVDGEVRQSGNTSQMVFGVNRLISFLSGVMTLQPGDLIATGTCDGIGPVAAGQTVQVRLGQLGRLTNRVCFAGSQPAGESPAVGQGDRTKA